MTTSENIVTMPHSRAAEESLIGCALIDSEIIRTLTVEPEDFYIRRNAYIWAVIQDITREGREADYITICARLDEKKQLAEIGGPAYVTSLISAAVSSLNAASYADIIQERARRRKIIYAAQNLTTVAYNNESDIAATVGDTMDILSKTIVTNKGATHISQFASLIYDEVSAAISNPRDLYGIPTGFADIDTLTSGLQPGEKWVLSGPPGVGKSLLAVQMLMNAASNGFPGALYELEMSGRQVARRGLSALSHVKTQAMRSGRMTDAEVAAFTKALQQIEKLPVYVCDASDITTTEIRADLMRLKQYYGVKVCMVDYEGLLGDSPDQRDENVRSKIISKRVHDIAKDLDLAVLAIGDMTKEGIKGQVRGQGAVAGTARALHDADQIIVISKIENNENMVRLTWEKMREGAADRFVDLVKINGYPMFGSIKR